MSQRIGIDLDNTIICYDAVFSAGARDRGLLPAGFVGGKDAVKKHLQALPGGESSWQSLQGWAYGAGIGRAEPCPGVWEALEAIAAAGNDIFVVSHKTRFGHQDAEQIDLREAALDWLGEQGAFDPSGRPLRRDRVFFEDDRVAKVKRIGELELETFIDDLPEVFETPGFPTATRPILYGGTRTWPAIRAELLS